MIQPKSKIFVIDDHPLVREWLANLISQQPDLAVCGEVGTAAEALKRLDAARPDLAIVDISLGERSGLEFISTVTNLYPKLFLIVLSMHDERIYAERALRAGARGYVMKSESTTRIVAAIRQVLGGKVGVSEEISALLSERFVGGRIPTDQSPIERLSNRELEIFQLLGKGRDTRSVAASLNISIKTVQAHCAGIKEKLGLANATELLREAVCWAEKQTA